MNLSREELEQESKAFEADLRARDLQLSQLKDLINNNMDAIKQMLKLQNRTIELHEEILDRLTYEVKMLRIR
jgi:hypothetical protein